MHVLYILLCTVQFFIGVALVAFVTMQESKNDGLQGQIGTVSTSSFKGKAGREEQLNMVTRNTAIAFMTISVLVAFGSQL